MPLTAAILLVQDYGNDLGEYIKELTGEIEKANIVDQIEQANLLSVVQGIGKKKGHIFFTKWRRKKLEQMFEIDEKINEDKKTVFEKLIKQNKPKTVFDNLIKIKGK